MTKNYKGKGGGGLQENWLPINCQWGGGEHENITEPDGGLGKSFFVPQPKSSDPALFFSPGDK